MRETRNMGPWQNCGPKLSALRSAAAEFFRLSTRDGPFADVRRMCRLEVRLEILLGLWQSHRRVDECNNSQKELIPVSKTVSGAYSSDPVMAAPVPGIA